MTNIAPASQADVVIIGGGIMGCAIAYNLARRGVQAVLLEKGKMVGEQSSRAWGFVRQQNRDPAELPLMIVGNRIWRELSAELQADVEWRAGGILSLAGNEAELAHYEAREKLEREHGVDSRMVTPEEIRGLMPGFAGQVLGGLHTASDGNAEPLKASSAFAAAAERAGAKLHPYCTVEGFTTRDGKIASVITDKGEIRTETVVCAAGAHSSKLARMVGLDLPMRTVRATVAATEPLPEITQLAVRGVEVSFRQRASGSVYMAQSVDNSADYDLTLESFHHLRWFMPNYLENRRMVRLHIGKPFWDDLMRAMPWSKARRHPFAHAVDLEPKPNQKQVQRSREALMGYFPHLKDVRIERTWAGMIDTMPDMIPVLGPAPELEGFIFATGFSGHGFAMGPIVGRLISELILNGGASLDIHGLRFSRFAEGKLGAAGKVR
ncbi:MAG: FAD-binding oxidoreductase [SAR324 cluster bacterium]|nr:FAD-binding oxidoreductase [SAR324 cluster bacterium]